MGAKVESSNDTKAIIGAMKDLAGQLADLGKTIGTMQKLQGQIAKTPDECADPVFALRTQMDYFMKSAKELAGIDKTLKTAVTK